MDSGHAMNASSLRRIFISAGLVSLLGSYLGIWVRFMSDPVQRTGSDFIHFYSAGKIAQNEGMAHVYDLSLQQGYQEEQVGFPLVPGQVLPYNHLPFLIPILQTIVSADYVSSFYKWVLIMLFVYLISNLVFYWILRRAGMSQRATLLTVTGGLLFLPVFFSLMNGQDTAILFVGISIWVYGLTSGKDMAAGLGLSLSTVRPHIALILALPMLFHYRKVFLGFMLGSGILALLSFSILGTSGTRDFIDVLLVSAEGQWYGMKQFAMFNLIGLLTRSAPQLEAGTIRALGWGVYGLTLVFLCVVWSKTKGLRNRLIGLSVTLALFAAPHLHFHDLALLLIPVYEFIRLSRETGHLKPPVESSLPIALSLLLLLSNLTPFLQYTIPYIMLLVLAVYPYYATRRTTATAPHQS